MKTWKTNFSLLLISVVSVFFCCEFIYSYLLITHKIKLETIWFHEASDPGNNLMFDPEIGYTISKVPSLFGAVKSDGKLESIGIMEGNNFGFPDKRNFILNPRDTSIKRIAILGDSFTASQFTEKSWVEIIEKKLNDIHENDSIILMNFSLDGGGLGNWQSIVRNILLKNNLKIDAIIFAVLGDDLDRHFMWKNDYKLSTGTIKLSAGRNNSWDPTNNPTYEDTLNPFFLDRYLILPKEEINQIQAGNWELNRPIRPYLFLNFIDQLKTMVYESDMFAFITTASASSSFFSTGQLKLIEMIHADIEKLKIPAITFSFLSDHKKSKYFADLINSSFIDDQSFQKWIRQNPDAKLQIEGDGHWNDLGTKVFAKSSFSDLDSILTETNIIN